MSPRILCLILLILEARGFALIVKAGLREPKYLFIFYTQLSNMMAALSALLLVIFGQPAWVTGLRYLATCMLVMTAVVTACVLVPLGGDPRKLLFTGHGLYVHLLCPLLCAVSYIVFEEHAGRGLLWLPVTVTFAYGMTMLYLNWRGKVDGPYPFFRVRRQSAAKTVLWMAVLLAAVTMIALLVGMA